ncbi:OBAP family protein [Salinisphaera sp. SWV1]|uniref:OBAP family protein n=1 Tax=Salinisphaera sp. SWV1 TaxID=3454139 RepID=UPI003F8752FE
MSRFDSAKLDLLPRSRRSLPTGTEAALGFAAGLAVAGGFWLGRRLGRAVPTGGGHPPRHQALDTAAALAQRKIPLESMNTYLNGFHMYADDMGRQVEASHFCMHLAPDLHQCVIFDANAKDAKLIGIEYIISVERYARLPDDEKRLWHSHHYEIKSGQLVAPGIPEMAEHAYFEDLVTTYGKTFHTWQVDRDDFPYGVPQLMMAFTEDGQIDAEKLAARDRRLGVDSDKRRANRVDIPTPHVQPQANCWQSGQSVQTALHTCAFHRTDGHGPTG